MNNNENNFSIDYERIMKTMLDKILIDFLGELAPDEETRKVMTTFMHIHRKYGIDASTSLKIMRDIAEQYQK